MIHIIPLNDLKPHTEDSMCTCGPSVITENGEMICTHNAYDGREYKEEKPAYNWANLKAFCDTLTEDQLSQPVRIFIGDNESPTDVDCAEELGEDHYYFPEHEYSCTKNDFDKNCVNDDKGYPLFETFEQAIGSEVFYLTHADRVYLHAFL